MDSKAAMGMAQRVGLQKVRHVEVEVLWFKSSLPGSWRFASRGSRRPDDLCGGSAAPFCGGAAECEGVRSDYAKE